MKARTIQADPLAAFMDGAVVAGTRTPVPLIATDFDVKIVGGLAVVTTRRLFRNVEPDSIEATVTFPVPVSAALFALNASVDGRCLTARATCRSEARETYEDALDRGKTSVLHEEVLKGVHMLSVGHIRSGGEVEMCSKWAAPLTLVEGQGYLRIPLTVGDIYGRSGLQDSDVLIHGGPTPSGALAVDCLDGSVELVGGTLDQGRSQVTMNAPIDLIVRDWTPRDLYGRAANGEQVHLRIAPLTVGEQPLSVALLVDHSGSMDSICADGRQPITKHQATVAGLNRIAERLQGADSVELWEFDDTATRIGSTRDDARSPISRIFSRESPRRQMFQLVDRLSPPQGGTEIGSALACVLTQSATRDVLLVTDGKSYALDVHALARSGRRIFVVLVGEDSLEANVGHLAALTGGDIFVSSGSDIERALSAAIGALRRPASVPARIIGPLREIQVFRNNASIAARWRPAEISAEGDVSRGTAALAASLALPLLDEDAAAELAETEGLVTHSTSLILVDEAGEMQDGIPATRKVALPTPRTDVQRIYFSLADPAPIPRAGVESRALYISAIGAGLADSRPLNLWPASEAIDWGHAPEQLLLGDLSFVVERVAAVIREAAAMPGVIDLAEQLDLTPIQLVIGLLARAQAKTDRSAARVAKRMLGTELADDVIELSRSLGLDFKQSRA